MFNPTGKSCNYRLLKLMLMMLLLTTAFLIASCSSVTQMYSGPEKPTGEIALVRGADASIDIVRCDGVRLSTGAATVLPGEHTVEVTYSELNRGYSLLGTILLAWKAEAGHTYVVDKIIHAAPGMSRMFIIDAETKKEVSRSLLKPGSETERLRMYETKIKEFPQSADFWAYKGYLLVRLQRYEEAMSALDTALNLQPDMADAWLTRSLAFFQQKRYDESLTAIDKTIQLRGSEEDKKFREGILKKMEENKKAQSQ